VNALSRSRSLVSSPRELEREATNQKRETRAGPVDYLIIGHVTQDRVPSLRSGQADGRLVLGGTATYSALTARNLGQRVAALTSAAFDAGLVDVLQGIQVARLPAEQTTRFVNTYHQWMRQQHIEAQANSLRAEHLPPDWRTAPIVHLAPVAAELDPDIVTAFPDALVGVTPQGWMRAWDQRGLVRAVPWDSAEAVLARADVVILSEQDVHDPDEINRLADCARLLVVTRGERGASVYRGGHSEARHFAAFRARRQVDPSGAGDVFAAAYLVHLRKTGDPYASAEFGNCVASFAVERRYFRGVPTLAQVAERWQARKLRQRFGPP
jgi:1D-myo-inositol 3-kinase